MRKLIYVPIIHTGTDMGSLAGFLKEEYQRRSGLQRWQEHVDAIARLWRQIYDYIMGLELEWTRVRIYQDGLPVCGREGEIAGELAKSGSVNYKLILDLIDRGAKLEGTEDSQALLEEHNYLLRIACAKSSAERSRLVQEYTRVSREVLVRRDRFMAQRIAATLSPGETGVLFLGMLHKVERFLPRDIHIEYPLRFPLPQIKTTPENGA